MNLDDSLAALRKLINRLAAKPPSPEEGEATFRQVFTRGVFFLREPYGRIGLIDDELESYRKCLHDVIESATKGEVISRSAVESHVQLSILKALDMNGVERTTDFDKRLSEAIKELKSSLSAKPEQWELHMQVLGALS